MQSRMKQYKQRGIGLLELMLAMAIMAILILVSIQYFGSTKRSTYLSAATQEVQTIISIVNGMTSPARTAGCDLGGADSSDACENMDITTPVALSGSLPKAYVKGAGATRQIYGPWGQDGGEFTVFFTQQAQSDGSGGFEADGKPYADIVVKGLPNYACESLKQQFTKGNGIAVNYPTCVEASGVYTLTIRFYFTTGQGIEVNTLSKT